MNPKLDNIIMDPSNDKFKDECGVFGVYSNREIDVASITYYGLYALQHRGQESAGIAVANGEDINIKKRNGAYYRSIFSRRYKFFKRFYSNWTCLDIQQVEILELKMHSHY